MYKYYVLIVQLSINVKLSKSIKPLRCCNYSHANDDTVELK